MQARAYSAYRVRLAWHWSRMLEGQQQRRRRTSCGSLPPPNADEWQYAAALRGVRGMQEHALMIAACAVAAVLCLL